MSNSDPISSELFGTVESSRERSRRLYVGVLGVLGVTLAGVHVLHFVADLREGMSVPALVTGAILPLLLALGIVLASYQLRESSLGAEQLRRVDLWVLIGVVGMTVVSGAFFTYEAMEGATLTHPSYLLLDFATTGAVGGLLVGWYDARTQKRTSQLRVFRKAVEHAGHSVYLTTPDGTIEYVNPEFETQTGYTRAEALGATPRILKSGEQDESFYEEMWETILSGDVWDDELINERKDGSYYHVDQTIAPVTDERGEIERFVAINNDITDLKEYERELERQNDRLDEFANVVSHDLRNPLNVATARIDIARNECESAHLDEARDALDRMEQLIDDVLTLARQGETISDREPVSLRSVCEEAWQQVEAPDASLSVPDEQSIAADASRVQQLLENLFRNAVEHGGEDVTVRVGPLDERDGFYVEDDGTGFGENADDDLFESGYTTADEGTGLGLAIVKQIVDAHGWEITAEHGDGGARFEISGVERVSPAGATESGRTGGGN